MCPDITTDQRKTSKLLSIALLCAVMVPQLGLSMSTPALPEIAADFHVSISYAQSTMIIYMIGYALSMLLSGLLSDRFGPRQVQICGLLLASISAMLSAFSPNIFVFTLARFLQAFGGCIGTVTTRLIIREEYAENNRMKILTTLTSAIAVTPCIAPFMGGVLVTNIGWRGIFITMAIISFVVLILFWHATRLIAFSSRSAFSLKIVAMIYLQNLKNVNFCLYAIAISSVWMSYCVFVSCSSYPFQVHLGISPPIYGLVLAISAVGYVLGSTTTRLLSYHVEIDTILKIGAIIGFSGGVIIIFTTNTAPSSLLAFVAPMILILFSAGMVIPATQAGFLKSVTHNPGISSGLFFFCQMIAGAIYAVIGNSFSELTPIMLGILVALPCFALPIWLYLGTYFVRRKKVTST